MRHIRRPQTPVRGTLRLGCDCGWHGAHVPRPGETAEQGADQLNAAYRRHLSANEARTYLLLDTRPAGEDRDTIVGNFVMPIGDPILLEASREEDGVHYGSFRMGPAEPLEELPVGEVRTPDGKVFRLDE